MLILTTLLMHAELNKRFHISSDVQINCSTDNSNEFPTSLMHLLKFHIAKMEKKFICFKTLVN